MIVFILIFLISVFEVSDAFLIFDLNKTDMTIFFDIENLKVEDNPVKLTIDTMNFYSGVEVERIKDTTALKVKKVSSSDSYRSFEGFLFQATLPKYSTEPFYIVGLESNNINSCRYILNSHKISYGYLGLAKSYEAEVLVNEVFFFGADIEYSVMNFLLENHKIKSNIIAFEKNQMILGKTFKGEKPEFHIYKTNDDLEYSYKNFFWNFEFDHIKLFGKSYEISSRKSVIIDSLMIGVIFPFDVLIEVVNDITKMTNGKCIKEPRLICEKEVDLRVFENFELVLPDGFSLKKNLAELFYFREKEQKFDSYIEFSNLAEGITVGKWIFDNNFVELNKDMSYVAFSPFSANSISINSNTKKNIYFSNIVLMIINSLWLIFLIYKK